MTCLQKRNKIRTGIFLRCLMQDAKCRGSRRSVLIALPYSYLARLVSYDDIPPSIEPFLLYRSGGIN